MTHHVDAVNNWQSQGAAKIVLKSNLEEIFDFRVWCHEKRIPLYLVHDMGKTQIPAGSPTVLSFGPLDVQDWLAKQDQHAIRLKTLKLL
jgi:peptidyl-tRNA hydrolase